MRITKISVKGLFGMFDHEIPLNQDERITIVHGPNGVGKTVLLRMVDGLFHFSYHYLGDAPFDYLSIYFDDDTSIHVQQIDDRDRLLVECTNVDWSRDEVPFMPTTYMNMDETDFDELVSSEVPRMLRVPPFGVPRWVDVESYDPEEFNMIYTEEDIIENSPQIHEKAYGSMPDWFVNIRREASMRLIHTQRLHTAVIVPHHPFDLMWDDSDRQLSSLEAVLGTRLEEIALGVRKKFRDFLSNNEIDLNTLMDVDSYMFQRLQEGIDEARRSGFYNDERELFEEIVNERFLFKSIQFDEDEGLAILSESDEYVNLAALSAGEQHLLVLYYQLLFETEPDTLVMIDEPELSMNVVWQRNFLKDLQRIIELRKFDVLIATHSPQIIHDKWDWVVHLGEKVDD